MSHASKGDASTLFSENLRSGQGRPDSRKIHVGVISEIARLTTSSRVPKAGRDGSKGLPSDDLTGAWHEPIIRSSSTGGRDTW